MMIGGAALAKTAEQFPAALPARSRALAELAYDATAVAGIAGTLLVVAGAVIAAPGFVRFVRAKRWFEVRRVFWTSVIASATMVAVALGLSRWAHGLTSAQRNGTDGLYSSMFLVFVLVVVVTIALWARTCVAIASRIDFTSRELRLESVVAFGVSLTSIVVIASTSVWWIQMGLHAPWFLEGTSGGIVASLTSAQLLAIMVPMVLGTLTAAWGASRVALTYRSTLRESR
jgi:hypothetical protein